MDKTKLLKVFPILLLTLSLIITYSYAEIIVIIDPEDPIINPIDPPPTEPPVEEPPVVEPPIEEPPVVEPPIEEPPVVEPPIEEPPVVEPPIEEPPVVEPPVEEPPVVEPPVEEPPVVEPPIEEPPVVEPPVEEPPVVEPPVEEPPVVEPPVIDPAPPTAPKEINATIDIDPNVINTYSHRNFIECSIELPSSYSVNNILTGSIKICSINGVTTNIYPLNSPASFEYEKYSHIKRLAIKFNYNDLKAYLTEGTIKVKISGDLTDNTKFYGEDTVRTLRAAIKLLYNYCYEKYRDNDHKNCHDFDKYMDKTYKKYYNKKDHHKYCTEFNKHRKNKICYDFEGHKEESISYHDWSNSKNKNNHGSKRSIRFVTGDSAQIDAKYYFAVSKQIPSNSKILKAFLWYKTPDNSSISRKAWMLKSQESWEEINGKLCQLGYANVKRGNGYEWDVTDQIQNNWSYGITEIAVKLEKYENNKQPELIVTYEPAPAISAIPDIITEKKEEAKSAQNLKPVGIVIENNKEVTSAEDNTITLYYSESDIQNTPKEDLAVYSWNAPAQIWQVVSDAVINYEEKSFSCKLDKKTAYQIMAVQHNVQPAQQAEAPVYQNTLGQNYPNPFNPATTIEYTTAQDGIVTLKLYNTAGELIATLVNEFQTAGQHSVYYDGGTELPRGIYFYQLISNGFVNTKRMVVLK